MCYAIEPKLNRLEKVGLFPKVIRIIQMYDSEDKKLVRFHFKWERF